jgi:hypothetical protein
VSGAVLVACNAKTVGWPEKDPSKPAHEGTPYAAVIPLGKALATPYETDAHFFAYEPWRPVRLNKEALEREPVKMTALVFDVDDPVAHEGAVPEARPDWFAAEFAKIEALRTAFAGLFVYRTKKGYRLVGAMAEGMLLASPDEAGGWKAFYLAWCDYLQKHFGITADRACGQWTRAYRLPYVVRDGKHERREAWGEPSQIAAWATPPEVLASASAMLAADPVGALMPAPSGSVTSSVPGSLDFSGADTTSLTPGLPLCPWGADPGAHGAYLATIAEASVSGKDGSAAAFRFALALCRGLKLELPLAFYIFKTFFNPRCTFANGSPCPWTDADIMHKLTDAAASSQRTLGYLLEGAPAPPPGQGPAASGWVELGVAQICAPLPPVPWLVQDLGLAPGAPAIIGGYGYSGKTVAAQALAVAIAAGQPVWGAFAARQGRVLHIDYEQGARLTSDRYQRLMVGMGVTPEQVGDRLTVVSMPSMYLSDAATEAFLTERCQGVDLVIIDSLHASCPAIEENEAGARRYLDVLGRVSERTGCAFLVIHHARKPTKDGVGGAKMVLRGSGALFDACASVLIFGANQGEPPTVTHTKARITGKTSPDFVLKIEDTPDSDQGQGLTVRRADSEIEASTQLDRVLTANCARIRTAFTTLAAGEFFQSKDTIRAKTGIGKAPFLVAYSTLLGRGELLEQGTGASRRIMLYPPRELAGVA